MVVAVSRSSTVSRTSSGSSSDFTVSAFNAAEQRRTRKRITAAQLVQLEELYYRSSHPTRDQRDALAKRIQMQTKSVTIWFQNKRQTDRKVALHNATNSRNEAAIHEASDKPKITLTTPTSPVYPPEASVAQEEEPRPASDRVVRKQSITRSNAPKGVPSNTSSVPSTSSISSISRTRPSLDRVASRSEIRFTDRASLRSASNPMPVRTSGDNGTDGFGTGVTSKSDPPPALSSAFARRDNSASVPSGSPRQPTNPPLWTTMLSSPVAPSSPPTAEDVVYSRTRKGRTLDWACAAARFARGIASSEEVTKFCQTTRSFSGPAISLSEKNMAACEQEYEEAIAMTEDEAELITPHGSQDVSMPWAGESGDAKTLTRTCYTAETMSDMSLLHETDKVNVMLGSQRGWEEDEMHAALALCGLRG